MAQQGVVADTGDIQVVIEDENDGVRYDAQNGVIETDQPDGGVVVQLFPNGLPRGEDDADSDDPEKFYENLAERIDPSKLMTLAEDLWQAVSADDNSRQNWLRMYARGLELLGTELKEPSSGIGDSSAVLDGMSVVTNPLLLEACLKGWAGSQAELLPAEGPCKIDEHTNFQTGETDELAEALELGMNVYLTDIATEYAPSTSAMLLWGVYFGGCGFKKVYHCPIRRRPVSEYVQAKNFIMSDATTDLQSCGRLTHEISMRVSVMKRMILSGHYRDVQLTQPTAHVNVVDEKIGVIQGVRVQHERPEDEPYKLWEIQCELDLPEFAPVKFKNKGVPLPYLVTLDKDTHEILALRRDWRQDDEEASRKEMFVQYTYVPGPGAYGTGLLNILGNSSAAMTAAWREALDAGMYANFPAFLMTKLGNRQNTSDMRAGPAQGIPIETNGKPIQDVVMGLPYKDVTPGLMTLMDKITAQAKEAGGTPDIPVSEGVQNVPVGTMMAAIEQATKIMAAAHKGLCLSQSLELTLLCDLFREDPESFWRGNKQQIGYWDEQKLLAALDDYTLAPKADPNTPSHIHRIMRAAALAQLCDSPSFGPQMNKQATLKRILRAMKEVPDELIAPPPPPSDPNLNPDLIEARAKEASAQGKIKDADAKMAGVQVRAAEMAQKGTLQTQALQAEGAFKSVDLAGKLVDQGSKRRDADRTHALNVSKHQVDTAAKIHQAALDTHEVLNPESPKGVA